MELDIVRLQLGKMTDRILMRLHDRQGFPLNRPVYEQGAIPVAEGESLLEYALIGLERYHALLGRYEFPDQHPLMEFDMPPPATKRVVDLPPMPRVQIPLRDRLLPFYIDDVLPRLCEPGSKPGTHGETAYVDADLLELLNERINLGRQVALSKLELNPAVRKLIPDTDALIDELRDLGQEANVLAKVRQAADRYALSQDLAESVFKWVIEQTIHVEVAWLQGLRDE